MRYDHMVKVNGKYYSAGEDVPENGREKKADKLAVEETLPPYSDEEITLETHPEVGNQYTKTEIMKMKTEDLQDLAMNVGIEDASEMTGSALKKVLIEKFGL